MSTTANADDCVFMNSLKALYLSSAAILSHDNTSWKHPIFHPTSAAQYHHWLGISENADNTICNTLEVIFILNVTANSRGASVISNHLGLLGVK